MLSKTQAHLLNWIKLGTLLERTDVTGAGAHLEYFMGGAAVERSEIEALESQGLIEALSTWTIHDYGYVRYGLTTFGLTVLHTYEQEGSG